MIRPMLLRLFAIAGMATGLLAQAPHAQAAPAQFQLHFRCSPWLYMTEVTGDMRNTWRKSRGTNIPMNVAAVNARLCTQNADRITYATNAVFALNGIPATFTYTTEVIAGGGMSAVGLNYRVATFDNVPRGWAADLINARTPFPDLTVDDVELVRDVNQSTCDTSKVGTADCASLVVATCPDNATISNPFILCRNAAGGSVFGRISPFVSGFSATRLAETDRWGISTAASGARKINITVRYLPEPGSDALAIAHGVYDRASTALSFYDGTLTKRALTPANYLPTLGVVTVVAGGPLSVFNIVSAPHEIGHVFGALHERSAMEGSAFFLLAGLNANSYQFANRNTTGTSYDTLMAGTLTSEGRLNFSTNIGWKGTPPACPPGKTCPPAKSVLIGNEVTNNRRYVFETIQWITGDASLALSTPSHPTGNVLEQALRP